MEKLLEILKEINDEADFDNCETLLDDKILNSLDIMSIVSEIEDEFDVTVTPDEIKVANFNSAKAMWEMIKRLQK